MVKNNKTITQKISETEIYKEWLNDDKAVFDKLYSHLTEKDKDFKKYLYYYTTELYTEYNDVDALFVPMIYRICNSVYKKLKDYDFDLDYVVNTINDRLYDMFEFNKKMIPNLDYQAETCAILSSDVYVEIIELNRLKKVNLLEYKKRIRERKLKRIIG